MPLNRKTVRARRLIFLSLVALTALAAGLYFLIRWNTHDRFYVTTDNAFVVATSFRSKPTRRASSRVLVEETNKVKAGELLVRLDEQRAKAMLDQFAADLARAVRSVGGQFAARRQACQKIASQIALRDKTRHDVMRYRQALRAAPSRNRFCRTPRTNSPRSTPSCTKAGRTFSPSRRGSRADPHQDSRDRGGHGQIRRELHRIRAPAHQGRRFPAI